MFSVYVDGNILFATGCEANSPHGLKNPKLSVELGKTGKFTATVPLTNEAYHDITLLKSQIVIKLRQKVVWVGRVQFMDNTVKGMSITCVGILSYFNDTVFSPQSELNGIVNVFKKAIEEHNEKTDDSKKIEVGVITVTEINIQYDGYYINTLKLLNSLVDDYGGYLVPHYTESGNYIDWLKDVDEKIEGHDINIENLQEFRQSIDGSNIKTVIRPTGKNNTEGMIYVTNDVAVALFGTIEDVVNFPDIEDDEELEDAASSYLEDLMWASMNIDGKTPEVFDVMNETGELPVGKLICVNVPQLEIGHYFAIMGIDIDLNNPSDCRSSFAANSIWTQISNGRESQTVVRTTGKLRPASSGTMTSQNVSSSSKSVSTSSSGKGLSGTVEFSNGTKLNFVNGLLTDGISEEGAF